LDAIIEWFERVQTALEIPLFSMSGTNYTVWTFVSVALLIFTLFFVAGRLRKWIAERALARTGLDIGARQSVATLVRYVVLLLGMLIIVQTVGINLTTLNVLAGAIGIGVGFGLQNVASNFISGIIIMFERPIKIGDRIVVDDVEGDVVEIGARSTVVLTNDNISIIVPNEKFVTENVVNWSHHESQVRLKVAVGVAYGTDLRKAESLLLQVAAADPGVHDKPEPVVRFTEFGDHALLLELRVWSTTGVTRKGKLISDLNFAIHETFRANGIEIPFPQYDLHIRSDSSRVKAAE